MPFRFVPNKELSANGLPMRLGRTYWKDGEFAFDVRCPICGKYVRFDYKEKDRIVREGRWDFSKDRMLHCGSSTCYDYQELVEKDKKIKLKMMERHYQSLHGKLMREGLAF